MVPGANDGRTTSESESEYDFKHFEPTTPLDHVFVNRLRKSTRNSCEPIDKAEVMHLLKRAKKKPVIPLKDDDSEND